MIGIDWHLGLIQHVLHFWREGGSSVSRGAEIFWVVWGGDQFFNGWKETEIYAPLNNDTTLSYTQIFAPSLDSSTHMGHINNDRSLNPSWHLTPPWPSHAVPRALKGGSECQMSRSNIWQCHRSTWKWRRGHDFTIHHWPNFLKFSVVDRWEAVGTCKLDSFTWGTNASKSCQHFLPLLSSHWSYSLLHKINSTQFFKPFTRCVAVWTQLEVIGSFWDKILWDSPVSVGSIYNMAQQEHGQIHIQRFNNPDCKGEALNMKCNSQEYIGQNYALEI